MRARHQRFTELRSRCWGTVAFFIFGVTAVSRFRPVDASFVAPSLIASVHSFSAFFTSPLRLHDKSRADPTRSTSLAFFRRGRTTRTIVFSTTPGITSNDPSPPVRTNIYPPSSTPVSPHIRFHSPLLEDGYPPAVLEAESGSMETKPLLLYLPGFDGTMLAPFLQFPSLGEEFDVRAMTVDMADRSTVEELRDAAVGYLREEAAAMRRQVYLVGESFGSILAAEVALAFGSRDDDDDHVALRGLVLVNPATSYLRSNLAREGPLVSDLPLFLYPFGLAARLVPLFLDDGVFLRQLGCILGSKGLPRVVNTAQREAYMGRVAFDLASRLKFMPKETLQWRLERWLTRGCQGLETKLKGLRSLDTLIVVGELDLTLPSIDEARRLVSEVFEGDDDANGHVEIHVVEGAGHATTCGGSLHLIQTMRDFFPLLTSNPANGEVRKEIFTGRGKAYDEERFGLVPRYDNAAVGLLPWLYWSEKHYRVWKDV